MIGNVDTVISPDANMTKYITEAFRRESCLIPYGVEALPRLRPRRSTDSVASTASTANA